MKIVGLLLCALLFSVGTSCQSGPIRQYPDSRMPQTGDLQEVYDLNNPAEKFYLPYVLEEVSGLSYSASEALLMVDDEKGKIFEFDLAKKEIVKTTTFHRSGDFEGVELVGKNMYVLRSDGNIYKVKNPQQKNDETKKYESRLGSANDTEGLGYDPITNKLLIACKAKGEIGKKEVHGKAIYGFDLETEELDKEPMLVISEKDINSFWSKQSSGDYKKKNINFRPSAIAFHPIQKLFYVLSSSGKLLVVVDREGRILATYPISAKRLHQPEGICFSPTGEMYISSEGDGGRGYVLKYDMKRE